MSDRKPAARFQLAFLGHYTKDTIVSRAGTRVVDGGAINYGAHVAAAMGLEAAVITRLAREDMAVVDRLRNLGIYVMVEVTPVSTCLHLEYPTDNPDERTIAVISTAGPFTAAEIDTIDAEVFVVGPSIRGEVGPELLETLGCRGTRIAVDVQGFLRVARSRWLVHEPWPDQLEVLSQVEFVKVDAVEAEALTGERDMRSAAKALAGFGPREVILTHHHGVLVYAAGVFHEAPFHPQRLVGRSGRGDTCVAAYVAHRLSAPAAVATIWAAAATSLKLEAEGPLRRTRAEIEQLIQRYYI